MTVVRCQRRYGLLVFYLIFYQCQVKAAAVAIIVLAGRVHLSLNQTCTAPSDTACLRFPSPYHPAPLNLSASTTNTESWPQNEVEAAEADTHSSYYNLSAGNFSRKNISSTVCKFISPARIMEMRNRH